MPRRVRASKEYWKKRPGLEREGTSPGKVGSEGSLSSGKYTVRAEIVAILHVTLEHVADREPDHEF